MPAPRFVLDDFWPSDLFLGGIPGAWYDPTDLSTMFQDSTGTTPVTAVEQPVGLILDKSQGLALGSDIVVNGNFASAAGWLTPGSWTIGSGVATASGGGYLYRTLAAVSGYKVFRVTFDLVTRTAGSVQAYMHNGTTAVFTPAVSAPGSYSFVLAHTNVNELGFLATALTGSVDNLSIRELAGNHASQSTAASRPTYRARYNLVTYSEEFQNGYWSKTNATVSPDSVTAPNGTTTADTITENLVVGGHFVRRPTVTTSRATTYTWSAYAKPNGRNQILLGLTNAAGTQSEFLIDLTTLAVTLNSNGAGVGNFSGAASSVGNGWVRVSITFTTTNDANGDATGLIVWLGNSKSYAGDGASGIFLWGAQLLTAADVTATGNAYQRIAAATVYDTAAVFRPYLAFDGMDDSLSTAAVNFTSTDKMTVFAGETKLQDAALGVLAELSTDAPGTNGTFWLLAPYTATERYSALSRGTSFTLANSNSALDVSPNTSVLTARLDISAPLTQLSVNRAVRATNTASQGTGNYGNWPLFIGRRNNSTFPFNGRLYSLIVRGAASSVTEIADTELWVNARTGAF